MDVYVTGRFTTRNPKAGRRRSVIRMVDASRTKHHHSSSSSSSSSSSRSSSKTKQTLAIFSSPMHGNQDKTHNMPSETGYCCAARSRSRSRAVPRPAPRPAPLRPTHILEGLELSQRELAGLRTEWRRPRHQLLQRPPPLAGVDVFVAAVGYQRRRRRHHRRRGRRGYSRVGCRRRVCDHHRFYRGHRNFAIACTIKKPYQYKISKRQVLNSYVELG